MNKDKKAQKERFLHEAERQLLRKGFGTEGVGDELLRVQRDQLMSSVTRSGYQKDI